MAGEGRAGGGGREGEEQRVSAGCPPAPRGPLWHPDEPLPLFPPRLSFAVCPRTLHSSPVMRRIFIIWDNYGSRDGEGRRKKGRRGNEKEGGV